MAWLFMHRVSLLSGSEDGIKDMGGGWDWLWIGGREEREREREREREKERERKREREREKERERKRMCVWNKEEDIRETGAAMPEGL